MNNKLFELIKTTLIEKDDSNPVYGSIKRWAAWILLFLIFCIVQASILPSFSMKIGTFIWNFERIPVDKDVLRDLLAAIGTYILTGQLLSQATDTIQNYHNQKLGNKSNGDNDNKEAQSTPQ